MIYREYQCGGAVVSDSLCKTCLRRKAAYKGEVGVWHGLITEEPPSWMHMLGTDWAAQRKPVWTGTVSASGASSVASAASAASREEIKAAEKALRDAEKMAEKAKKETEKAAEKARKEAEKEAARIAKAAEKEAVKAIKTAERAEAKAARASVAPAPAPAPNPFDLMPEETAAKDGTPALDGTTTVSIVAGRLVISIPAHLKDTIRGIDIVYA